MKLAAMQPYFFPYLGHFDLLNKADLWIVYDEAQYIRHGWVNRNRVLHPSNGWQYILVPLEQHPHRTPISRIKIADHIDWKTRIFKQLQHYHVDAPYYRQVIELLDACLADTDDSLARLNTKLLRLVSHRLGINTPIQVFSEMDLPLEPGQGPENTALGLSVAVGAGEYINPPGGAGLYDATHFLERGIKLTIQSFTNMMYDCGRYGFEPALSILDVMMWNSPAAIHSYLNTCPQNTNTEGTD